MKNASEIVDLAVAPLPELMVTEASLPAAAEALRDLFATSGRFFERGGKPMRIIMADGSPRAKPLTIPVVINESARYCQPVKMAQGARKGITLPKPVAELYLALEGEFGLPPLAGITSAPILSANGGIRSADGYDQETDLFCHCIPKLNVPDHPSREEAEAALRQLRRRFQTFPFADAKMVRGEEGSGGAVDSDSQPGRDESAFLVGLMTAVCRPSLWLAPGLIITAPQISGAGTGKGLLARAISEIAFGSAPAAITRGHEAAELDKRLVAELREAAPMLFLDNLNNAELRSETLASVMTERPARVRVLGKSEVETVDACTFIAMTGNALTPAEDLARRFIYFRLDAGIPDPESRNFEPGFLNKVKRDRKKLLTAALIIWRWGRQNILEIRKGKALGGFEDWCDWCRDPLLALGCADPVKRISELKEADPERQAVVAFLTAWNDKYGTDWKKLRQVSDEVFAAGGCEQPNQQGRRWYIERLVGTRIGNWTMRRRKPAGEWARAEYCVCMVAQQNAGGG